jgi:hypothetical protein
MSVLEVRLLSGRRNATFAEATVVTSSASRVIVRQDNVPETAATGQPPRTQLMQRFAAEILTDHARTMERLRDG